MKFTAAVAVGKRYPVLGCKIGPSSVKSVEDFLNIVGFAELSGIAFVWGEYRSTKVMDVGK